MGSDRIVIRGAREHNLKNVDLSIPRDRLVVFTGLSGSGKSSLAFDTIYAEGQRRYVESLSAYARQFLGQMEKPDVDIIEGLSPAISIDQKGTSRNPRSTVGTVTEIYDYLRLLFARIGHPHCPVCGREIHKQTIEQMAAQVERMPEGTRLMILGPVVRGRKGEYQSLLEDVRRQGFSRVRVDGTIHELGASIPMQRYKKHDVEVVVDRVVVGPDQRTRLVDSLEVAAKLGQGVVLLVPLDGGEEVSLSQDYACPYDGISVPEPQPRSFSFNTPHGACPSCGGLGTELVADPELVLPDPGRSLNAGAIAPWHRSQFFYPELLRSLCEAHGVDMNQPWRDLDPDFRRILLEGTGAESVRFSYRNYHRTRRTYNAPFEGVLVNLKRRHSETDSDFLRAELEKYMSERACSACAGRRLKPESLAVTVGGLNIAQVCALSVRDGDLWFKSLELSEREEQIGRGILKEVGERLRFMLDVGLDYLSLARSATSLSGGESQRIRLATQIGSKLMGVLYILDEPSVGLHQRDNHRLIETLLRLRDLGNTLIVVEHDEDTIRAADWMVDIGPGAGEHGGRVVASGTVDEVMANPDSLTAAFLRGDRRIEIPARRRPRERGELVIEGAEANNLKSIEARIPLGCFVAVSGVSGSGKSSLVSDVLSRRLAQHFHGAKARPGRHSGIRGLELIDKSIDVDQSPIGRTPRSNPATYTGMFTPIRELFASLPEARVRGYAPGRFSFNVKGGRCEACQGDGIIQIEMQFLPDVYIPCEVCGGSRYTQEVQEVRFRGHSIADVLEMTVDEAMEVFENVPRILAKLRTLHDVGLGYIRLGQPATQLSGGEAQRVKLSTELSRRDTGHTMYVLDEPTTGLHYADVERLLEVLHRLVDHGNTVIVIEHNLDVLKTADWLIDLGPEGGEGGGELVASGTPEEVAMNPRSHTGRFLAPVLARQARLEVTA
ncbi:MAG TPA: excinuclease ABC subunit UvrA [Candidatus Nitrosotalea sp.]|nr:excinuclease ABC subunit UvrA [Candidatus Nitrosotalea sp.]